MQLMSIGLYLLPNIGIVSYLVILMIRFATFIWKMIFAYIGWSYSLAVSWHTAKFWTVSHIYDLMCCLYGHMPWIYRYLVKIRWKWYSLVIMCWSSDHIIPGIFWHWWWSRVGENSFNVLSLCFCSMSADHI